MPAGTESVVPDPVHVGAGPAPDLAAKPASPRPAEAHLPEATKNSRTAATTRARKCKPGAPEADGVPALADNAAGTAPDGNRS